MAEYNSIVQSVKYYEFVTTSLWLSIVHSKQWKSYSLDITRKFTYINYNKTKQALAAPI